VKLYWALYLIKNDHFFLIQGQKRPLKRSILTRSLRLFGSGLENSYTNRQVDSKYLVFKNVNAKLLKTELNYVFLKIIFWVGKGFFWEKITLAFGVMVLFGA
jgi:hypothetical protein